MSKLDPSRIRQMLDENEKETEAQEAVVTLLQGLVDDAERDLIRLERRRKSWLDHPDVQKALSKEAP